MQGRGLPLLETPEENPFAEISEQLTRLYAQKDAAVETVFARLAPLEAKLAEVDRRLAGRIRLAPSTASPSGWRRCRGEGRSLPWRRRRRTPSREISEQLTRLYAQKDAAVETVFARLAPLEAKLAEVDRRLAGQDPAGALDRFAERLEAVRSGLEGRIATLEAPEENPFAEISEQLTRLYAQKDAAVETVFARLAPLEAKLAEVDRRLAGQDPAGALDRFAERLEAVQGQHCPARDAGGEPLRRDFRAADPALRPEGRGGGDGLRPARAAGGEARGSRPPPRRTGSGLRPRPLRRAAGGGRRARAHRPLETPEENPFAEISEQLTRLYAQKDAAVETVFSRLAPLEAKLAEVEAGVAMLRPLADADPRAEIDGLAARIEALNWAQGEVAAGLAAMKAAADAQAEVEAAGLSPVADLADRLTRLYAQKDAGLAAVLERLAPLESRLSGLESRPWDPPRDAEAEEARDHARVQAQAIAAQMIAARTAADQVAAQTGLFADRLALLEASLPRLSAAQATLMQALEARTLAMAAPAIAAAIAPGLPLPAPRRAPSRADPRCRPGGAAAGVPERRLGLRMGPPWLRRWALKRRRSAETGAGPVKTPGPDDIWDLPRLISLHHR